MLKKEKLKENQIFKNSVIVLTIILFMVSLNFVVLQNDTIMSSISKVKAENEYEYGGVLKSQAKIECNKATLTALEEMNEIELVATMVTDNQNFCKLYKNPVITISVPENVTIAEIGDVVLLGETQLSIVNARIIENKIVVEMTGEQTMYKIGDINAQVKIPAKVSVKKFIKNTEGQISMSVQNANDTEARSYVAPINVTSIDGIVACTKIENYNTNGDILEFYNHNSQNIGNLEMDTEAKTVTVTGKILNNHNENLENVKLKFSPEWTHANGSKEVAIVNSSSFTNNEIVIENFELGQVVEFTAQITIPSELYFNEKLDLGFDVEYNYSETSQVTKMNATMQTEQKAGVGTIEKLFVSEEGSLRVETLAQVGKDVLINNDGVKEGSTIRYSMTVTNLTATTMENVKIKMTRQNDNTAIYDLKLYDTNILGENMYTLEELSDESIEKEIGTLEAKQIKTIFFEEVVKNDTENRTVVNFVDVSIGENVQRINTISNNIIDGDIKLNVSNVIPQVMGDNSITKDDENLQLTFNLEIANLKGEKITEDSVIEMELPSYIKTAVVFENDESVESVYENGKLTINVEKIDKETRLLKVSLGIEQMTTVEETLKLSFNMKFENETYVSNEIEQIIKYNEVKVLAGISANIPETTVINMGDTIEYTICISNNGLNNVDAVISDILPSVLQVQKFTVNNTEVTDYIFDEYNQLEYMINVPTQTEVIMKLTVLVDGEDDISNTIKVMVGSETIKETTISHKLYKEEDETEYDLNETEFTSEGPDIETETISIKGKVWLDSDKDGGRTESEQKISGITVRLINADNRNEFVKDATGNAIKVLTNENGEYVFNNLVTGNYFVLFEYDTDKYQLTNYQKEGVDSTVNSDVEDYSTTIEGKSKVYAITKTLTVNATISNIDMGLTSAPIFDLKVDKFISKVTVKNKQATSNYEYKEKNTVKVEIPGKYMDGSVIIAEYKIRITNQGEIAGYVTSLVDYLPKDMKFNTESNKEWFVADDGNIHNINLANMVIEPGKSIETSLVLTKTMTKDNTGVSENKVEIGSYSNTREKIDIDINNNKTSANLIVSVKTGELVLYITVVLACVAIVGAGIYVIKKRVIN